VEGLVIDGARLSAQHQILTGVLMAKAGIAKGMPVWHGMWSGI